MDGVKEKADPAWSEYRRQYEAGKFDATLREINGCRRDLATAENLIEAQRAEIEALKRSRDAMAQTIGKLESEIEATRQRLDTVVSRLAERFKGEKVGG